MRSGWLRKNSLLVCAVLLPALALALGPADAAAQREGATRLSLAVGATHLAHQDLIHTPFVHGGFSPVSFALRFERAGNRMHWAEASYASLTSLLTRPYRIDMGDHHHATPPHSFHLAEATYGLGMVLGMPARGDRSAALGVALRLDLQAVDYHYGMASNFGYFISPSLNLWYRHVLAFSERSSVAARLLAPAVSWVARSPYMVNDDRFIENIASNAPLEIALALLADGELAGWSRLRRLDAAIDYEYVLSRYLAIGGSYRFGYLRMDEPRRLTSLRSAIELTTSVRF